MGGAIVYRTLSGGRATFDDQKAELVDARYIQGRGAESIYRTPDGVLVCWLADPADDQEQTREVTATESANWLIRHGKDLPDWLRDAAYAEAHAAHQTLRDITRPKLLRLQERTADRNIPGLLIEHCPDLTLHDARAGVPELYLPDDAPIYFGGPYGEREKVGFLLADWADDATRGYMREASTAGGCVGVWAIAAGASPDTVSAKNPAVRWFLLLFDLAQSPVFQMQCKRVDLANAAIAQEQFRLLAENIDADPSEVASKVRELRELGTYAYLPDLLTASICAIGVLLNSPQATENPTFQNFTPRRAGPSQNQQVIEELERQTPMLDPESVEWLAARKENEKKLGLPLATLRTYRLVSNGGRKMPDEMFGIDRDGRRWRRQGTPKSMVYYYVPSLSKASKKASN